MSRIARKKGDIEAGFRTDYMRDFW